MANVYDNIINGFANDLSTTLMKMYLSFCNYLPVKAEPLSLLPIEVGGSKLEDLVDITIPRDDQFQFYMKSGRDLPRVRKAMFDAHPEYLQEIVPEIFYENQTEKEPTLLLTMPPVNKDRRDLLLKGVDGLYNDTKAKFERLKAICEKDLSENLSENPSMLDEAKEALENEYEKKKELLEQYKQKKIVEIEEAYRRYEETRQAQEAQKNGQNNNMSAEDKEVMNSMKFDSWKDY